MNTEHLASELGLTATRLERLRRLPFEQAVRELAAFKDEVRATYRKLVFKYHPDRNHGDASMFLKLSGLLREIDALEVQRPQPIIIVQAQRQAPGVVHYNVRPGAPPARTYDATKVVFIR